MPAPLKAGQQVGRLLGAVSRGKGKTKALYELAKTIGTFEGMPVVAFDRLLSFLEDGDIEELFGGKRK